VIVLIVIVYLFFPELFASINPFRTGLWLNAGFSLLN
jgi:hypothetical protein